MSATAYIQGMDQMRDWLREVSRLKQGLLMQKKYCAKKVGTVVKARANKAKGT